MKRGRKVWGSEQEKRDWLASPEGLAWVEKKIAEKNARRALPPGVEPECNQLKTPFPATVNGKPYVMDRVGNEWTLEPVELGNA